jgi:hypothetical protein
MKKVLLLSLLALLVAVLPSMNANAQGLDQIHYQGQLTMDGDKPVNGQVPITFSIYDQEFGGSALWVELQDVPVMAGFFNVYLGSVNPLNLKFDGQYWLEMQIGNSKYPRQQMTASPYAMTSMHAIDADTALVAQIAIAVADGGVTPASLSDELKNFTGDLEGEIPHATIKRGVITQQHLAPNVTTVPSGPASGDLTGTYPDPLIAVGAVKTDRIFNKAVTTAKIDDMAVTTDKINYQAVTPEKLAPGTVDQVLMTNDAGEVYWGIPELPEYPDGGVDIYGDYWTNIMVGGIHGRQIVEDPVNYPVNDGMVYMYDDATRMWIPVETAGDIMGPIDELVVTGIQEFPVSDVDPITGQVFMYDGTQWAPTIAAGDVTGAFDNLDINENTIDVRELVAVNDDNSGTKPRDITDNGRFMYFSDARMFWSKAAAGNDRMTAVWDDVNAEFIWDAPASNVTFPLMGTGTHNPDAPITLQGANAGNEILTWSGSAWEYDLVDELNLKTDIYPGLTEDGWVLTWDAGLGLMTWDEPYAKVWTADPIIGDGSAADPVAIIGGLDGEILYWDPTVNGGEWIHNTMNNSLASDITLNDRRAHGLDLQINADAVGTLEIATNAVTSDELAPLAVGTVHIQADAVTTAQILNETIIAEDIASNAVTTAKINPSVNADEFMVTTGGGTTAWANFNMNGQFTGNGVSTPLAVAADAITVVEIATDAVTGDELAPLAVFNGHINSNAVTTDKIMPSVNNNEFMVTNDAGLTVWSNFNINGQFTGDGIATPLAIAAGAVTSVEIAANAVTDIELADGAVDNAAIQLDAVTVSNILESPNPNQIMVTTAGGVTAWDSFNANAQFTGNGVGTPLAIAVDAITNVEIAANAVEAAELADDAVDTPAIQNNAVTIAKINPSLVANQIMVTTAGGVTAWDVLNLNGQFTGNGVGTPVAIAADAITNVEIALDAVTAVELADDAVDTPAIQNNAVTTAKVAPSVNNNEFMVTTDGGITAWTNLNINGQFTGSGIGTPLAIAADAVTAVELADNAVDTPAILDNAVTTAKIAAGNVTTIEILDGTIAAIDIADDAIESRHIAAGAINDATFIANDVINPDHMDPTGGAIGNALIIDAGNAPAWGTPDIAWTSLPDGTVTGQFAYWNGAAWTVSGGAAPTGTQVIKWNDGPGEPEWADDAMTIPFAFSGTTNPANDALFSLNKTDNMGDGIVVTVPSDALGSDANAIVATGGGPGEPTVDVVRATGLGLENGALRVDADINTLDAHSSAIRIDLDIADDGANNYNAGGIFGTTDVTGANVGSIYSGAAFETMADGGLVAGVMSSTDATAARNVGFASFLDIATPAASLAGLAAHAGIYTQVAATATGVEVDADQGIGINVQNDGANTTGIFINNGTGDAVYAEAQDAAALIAVSTTTGGGTVDILNMGVGEAILAESNGADPTIAALNASTGEAIVGVNSSATDPTAVFFNNGDGSALFAEAATVNGIADDNYVAVVRNNSGIDGRTMLIEGISETIAAFPPFDGVYGAYTDDNDAVLVVRNNNATSATSNEFLAIKTYGSIQANSGVYANTIVANDAVIVGDPNGANVTIVPPAVPGGPMVVGGPMNVEGDVLVGTLPYTFDNPSVDEDVYVKGNLEVDGTIFGAMFGTLSGGDGLDGFTYDGSANVTANVDVTEIVGAGLVANVNDIDVNVGNLIQINGTNQVEIEPSVTNGDLMQTVGGIATWQSIATVMADLEDGNGIMDFTYDGTIPATVEIELNANSGLQFAGANNGLEVNEGNGLALAGSVLSVDQGDGLAFSGTTLEVDEAFGLTMIANQLAVDSPALAGDGLAGLAGNALSVNAGNLININADAVEVAPGLNGQIVWTTGGAAAWADVATVMADLTEGFAVQAFTYDGSGVATVAVDAPALAGDGLAGAANTALSVNAGAGLEIDTDALRISAAAAGDGLAGGAGSPLEVTAGNLIDITLDAVTVEPSVTNGDLMQTVGGIATWQSIATVMADLEDGNGIADFTYDGSGVATVAMDITPNAGLMFTGASPAGTLGVNEGAGLNFAAGALQVNEGDGLAFAGDVLEVDEAFGLTMIANQLAVDSPALAGDGLAGLAGNALSVNVGDGLGITADVVAVELSATSGLEFLTGDLQVNTGNLIGLDGSAQVEVTAGADGQMIWTTGGAAAWADVSTVMDNLTDGFGIQTLNFDGSAVATVAVDAPALAGDGLTGVANTALAVNAGDGIELVAGAVAVDLNGVSGLEFTGVGNELRVDLGSGLAFNGNDIDVNLDGVTLDFTGLAIRVADLGIGTAQLANGSVIGAKLATDAVTGATIVTAINNGGGTIDAGRLHSSVVLETESPAPGGDVLGTFAAGLTINTASAATGTGLITAINNGAGTIQAARLTEADPTWSGSANETATISRSGQVTVGPAGVPVIIGDATAGTEVALSTAINWAGTYATTNTHTLLSIANTPGTADATNYGIYAKASGATNYAGLFAGRVSVDDADFNVTNAGTNVLFVDDDGVQANSNIAAGVGVRATLEATNAGTGEALNIQNTSAGANEYTAQIMNNGNGGGLYVEGGNAAVVTIVNRTPANDALSVTGGIAFTGIMSSNPLAGAAPIMLLTHSGAGSAIVATNDEPGVPAVELANFEGSNTAVALSITDGSVQFSHLAGAGGDLNATNAGDYTVLNVTSNVTVFPTAYAPGQIIIMVNSTIGGPGVNIAGHASGAFALALGSSAMFVSSTGGTWYRVQ